MIDTELRWTLIENPDATYQIMRGGELLRYTGSEVWAHDYVRYRLPMDPGRVTLIRPDMQMSDITRKLAPPDEPVTRWDAVKRWARRIIQKAVCKLKAGPDH